MRRYTPSEGERKALVEVERIDALNWKQAERIAELEAELKAAQGDCAHYIREADEARERIAAYELALSESIIAIDDWLNTYAFDLCSEERVKEAHDRIMREGGTLAYIAEIQQRNRKALAAIQEPGDA